MRPAVFLDRDGVLDEPVLEHGRERPPWTLEELTLLSEAPGALSQLRTRGWVLVVVTNQPDVGRGRLSRDVADEINDHVQNRLPVDAIYACFHGHDGECDCRKPKPGMLLAAASDLGLDLTASWMVGDRWVDIAAGQAAGVRTVLIERPGSWRATSSGSPPIGMHPNVVAGGIQEAATIILETRVR